MKFSSSLSRRVATAVFYGALVACGGDGGGNSSEPTGTASISVTPQVVSLVTGRSTTATISLTRTNRTDPLTLASGALPAGVTATFNPAVFTGSTLTATVTFTATVDAVTGGTMVNITATGTDGYYAVSVINLLVSRPQISVTRNGTGTGTVVSSPAGINCGSTCSTTFAVGTEVTLTATAGAASVFAGWTGGCTGTTNTCTVTVPASSGITATFNSTAQSFSFAATPTTVSVPQGGNGTATVSITRVNGYAGAVSLTATGAPTGVTITANPASVTGNSSALNIAATSAVAAGSYPITVSATGTGIPGTQTSTINLQVTPAAGGSGNIAFSFASCDPSEVPTWFATQSGSGPWTRVTAGPNNTFTFAAGATNGLAFMVPDGPGFATEVIFASRAEITSLALGSPCGGLVASNGTKHVNGTVAGIGPSAFATIAIGGASTEFHPLAGPTFSLDGVPAGRRDLIAANKTLNANGFTSMFRLLLRRNINPAANSTVPVVDFVSTEAFAPVQRTIVRNNLGTDQSTVSASFVTTNGSTAEYYTSQGGPNFAAYFAVPDTLLQPGDLHAVSVMATPASGSSFRTAELFRSVNGTDTVAFGPALTTPTVTSAGTSPYLRLRVQLASQAEYNAAAHAEFSQGANSFSVTTTSGYSGSTPANWLFEIPDLSPAGFDPTWGFKSGSAVDWLVVGAGGSVLQLLGATPVDFSHALIAGIANTSTTFDRLGVPKGWIVGARASRSAARRP